MVKQIVLRFYSSSRCAKQTKETSLKPDEPRDHSRMTCTAVQVKIIIHFFHTYGKQCVFKLYPCNRCAK